MLNQERELSDRIEGLKNHFMGAIEMESSSREALSQMVKINMKEFEKQFIDSQVSVGEQYSRQMRSLENLISDERKASSEMESRFQGSLDQGISFVQSTINKRMTESYEHNIETRQNVSQVAKTLQDSISIAEKSCSSKIKKLEDVLRAEIKSRMDTDATISGLAVEIKNKIDEIEEKTISHLRDSQEQLKSDIMQISEELKSTAELASEMATRSLTMLEVDVERISKSLKSQELSLLDNIKKAHDEFIQESTKLEKKLSESKEQLTADISNANKYREELLNRFSQFEMDLKQIEERVNEKFNFKSIQLDATMDTFKNELEARGTIIEMNQLSETLGHKIRDLEVATGEKLQFVNDESKITFVNKTEYSSEIDAMKALINEFTGETLTFTLKLKEIEPKIKELEHSIENHDSIITNMKDSKKELSKTVEKIKLDSEKCIELTNDFTNRILTINEILEENVHVSKDAFELKIAELTDIINLKAETLVVKEIDNKYNSVIMNIHDTVNAMQAALMDQKEEIADMEDAYGLKIDENATKIELLTLANENSIEHIRHEIENNIKQSNAKLLNKTTESISATNTAIIKQQNIVGKIETELIERSKLFNSKVKELFQVVDDINTGRDDFQDTIQIQIDRYVSKLGESEEKFKTRASLHDIEKLRDEIEDIVQKVESRIDINHLIGEQLQKRITEQEMMCKDRNEGLDSASVRTSKEQIHNNRTLKESINRRIDHLESKIKAIPTTETVCADIKEIRYDLKNNLQRSINKMETEIIGMRADSKYAVTQQNMDVFFANSISPLKKRMYQLEEIIENASKHSPEVPKKYYSPKSSVYKPADMSFGKRTTSLQRMDSVSEKADVDSASKVEII
jgi:chromosome segregation ATPase